MRERLKARLVSGGVTVAFLGVGFFASYVVYVLAHETYLQGPVWLLPLGVLLISVLSGSLIYGGYWVVTSEFSSGQGWRVCIWMFAGLIAALALTFWPIFYQRIVGVPIADPIFILLVSSGLGANAGVVAGVSQVQFERQFRQVQHARDSLEFLNRLLRHNVLNAITIIRGNAGLLIDENPSDVVVKRAQTIREQSDQIDTLIQNTKVLVRRIEQNPETEPVDLTTLTTDELDTARQSYDEANIESDLEPDVDVLADPLVSTVVENLLTNAIVHNDQETPQVEVELEATGRSAILRIADNGPGLPDEDEDTLVAPGRHGDHGLGLYLVDTLVSQYEGDLSFAESDPRGTTVTVELPLANETSAPNRR